MTLGIRILDGFFRKDFIWYFLTISFDKKLLTLPRSVDSPLTQGCFSSIQLQRGLFEVQWEKKLTF